MKVRLAKLAREPLVQFLALGACIYAVFGWLGTPDADVDEYTVRVDAARIQSFVGQWQQRWNRPPTRAELEGVIDAFVREMMLYRAAVEMGLDRDDPITRRRMAQKLEFLTNDIARVKEPAPGELEQFFREHPLNYALPGRVTLVQVFFDPDARGDATLGDAGKALERLQESGEPDVASLDEGDRNMARSYFNSATELDVRRELGTGFAEAVMGLDPGRWHGPVLSGFGTHLVYVFGREDVGMPDFDEVRDAVLADWQKQQQDDFNETFIDSLRERYEVVIAELPTGLLVERSAVEPASEVGDPEA